MSAVQQTGDPAAQVAILPNLSKLLVEQINEWGADIRFNTSLVQLLQNESGKVTGADGSQIMDASTAGMPWEAFEGMMGASLAAGAVQSADSIEELAKKMGIDPAGLKATIENYNAMAAAGVDKEFGKPAKDLIALNTPPFFGSFFGGHILCTLDGLKIDENMRVLNADKVAIPGLFAIGNCSGSMYAGSYPELFIGNACGRTCTQARHAVLYIKGEAA